MSLFCGIVNINGNDEIPEDWIEHCRSNISRVDDGVAYESRQPGSFLLKFDLGAFEGNGWVESESKWVAALVGDPVFDERDDGHRDLELHRLAQASFGTGFIDVLGKTRGSFAFARIGSNNSLIVTDKLGLRPVYWLRHKSVLIFSSAIRILKTLPGVDHRIDEIGLLESLSFGFCLGERTEYDSIKVLEAGTFLKINTGSVTVNRYWNWCEDSPEIEDDTPKLHEEIFNEFSKAIELRSLTDGPLFAALSGGLDSRCVVAVLGRLKRQVKTINVSWPNTYDEILARQFTDIEGMDLFTTELKDDETGEKFLERSAEVINMVGDSLGITGPVRRQLWGGNDGSISIGFVYVSQQTVGFLRQGDNRRASESLCEQIASRISPMTFRGRMRKKAASQPVASLEQALRKLSRRDQGQIAYMFLLVEKQRRMFHKEFEYLDQIGVERIEPFFDMKLLSVACKIPVESGLHHGFYNQWLTQFPRNVREVPWQPYPGHFGSLCDLPEFGQDQWQYFSQKVRKRKDLNTMKEFDGIIGKIPKFAGPMNWPSLYLVWLLMRLGVVNKMNVIRNACDAYRYVSNSS